MPSFEFHPAGFSYHTIIRTQTYPVMATYDLVPTPHKDMTRRIDGVFLYTDSGSLWLLSYWKDSVQEALCHISGVVTGGHVYVEGPFYLHGVGDPADAFSLRAAIFGTVTSGTVAWATAYGVDY